MAEGSREQSEEQQGLYAVLPWDKFSNWLHCICVVTFDLEIGQTLELVYPGHVRLSEQEKTNICYLAFPDSNSGCMGDTQFHMRIRQSPGRQGLTPDHRVYNARCPVHLQADPAHYHGYVYFRQIKDKTIPRGYFQKSVVLLSRLPFISLFHKVTHRVANEYFEKGVTSIEAACQDIDQWPAPVPGEQINLSLVGELMQTQIPSKSSCLVSPSSPSKSLSTTPSPTLSVSVHEVNLFKNFCPVLSHVHLLWELVLTAEPIIVMAPSPTVCSDMVYSLISMIVPLRYCADYRPFFTIHDSEFKEYTTNAHAPPSVILGVTNPFFAKTLQNWPHIIRLGESQNLATPQKHKLKKASNLKMLDSKPGVYTYYKSFLHKDKTLLKKLLKGQQTKRPYEVQDVILRRHLLELTQSFMIPLERYMASLMPLQKNISPYKAAPVPKPFNPDEFVATLDASGPHLTTGTKGDWVGLYRKFFRSCNFSAWYNARYRELSQKLQTLQLQALSDADLKVWVQGKQEVEVVDMVLQIRHKIEQSQSEELPLSGVTKQQLQTRLDDIIYTLPEDMRAVLRNC